MNDQPENNDLMGPSAELTRLLDAARADLPADAEWAQLSAQIAPIWGGEGTLGPDAVNPPPSHVSPTPGAHTGGTPGVEAGALGAKAGALTGAAKWLGALGVVGAVSVGTWVGVRQAAPVPPPPAVESAVAPPPAVSAALGVASASQGVSGPAPVAPASEQPVAPTAGTAKAGAGQRVTPSELALLTRARDALATNPERTLALCQQHQQAYPEGRLAQEREVLSIEALERLRRDTEAGQRRTRFGKTFPGSAHRSRVQSSKSQ